MMGLSFLCFILFACVYAEVDEKDAIIRRGGHLISFEAFKLKYNKNYASPREHQKRQTIFQENLKVIKSLNEREGSTIYGVNKFSDLSKDEFRARYLMQKGNFKDSNPNVVGKKEFHFKDQAFPGTFDWRSKNAVTPTKDQGQCGSCWAFSATEAIESQWFLAGNKLIDLAPQQIVDCDQGRGDQGCEGGDTTTAYEYVIAAGGMETESSYPYTGSNDPCSFNKKLVAAKISNWTYITTNQNETEMAVKLYNLGPLSICVDATPWQYYFGGIVEHFCPSSPSDLDHCVMITGYGYKTDWLDRNTSVWHIRNSWGAGLFECKSLGTRWGYDGYIYVKRGENLCGVGDEVTIPII